MNRTAIKYVTNLISIYSCHMNKFNNALAKLAILLLFSAGSFHCNRYPEVSKAKVLGKVADIDIQNPNFLQLISGLLKDTLVIQFVSTNYVISLRIPFTKLENIESKHILDSSLTGVNISIVKGNKLLTVANKGMITISGFDYKKDKGGFASGQFQASFPEGAMSGTFEMLISAQLSTYGK